eukprot:6526684-Prymnesium_polylepis.1
MAEEAVKAAEKAAGERPLAAQPEHLGPALEAPLRSGAIRLLDGKYVVEMAEEGRAMQPRQLLPPHAGGVHQPRRDQGGGRF